MKRIVIFLIIAASVFGQARSPKTHNGRPMYAGAQPNVLHGDGDSITKGFGTKAGYPDLVTPVDTFTTYNAGVYGQTTEQLAATGDYVDTLLAPYALYNIESVMIGTNDILNGLSPAECFARIKAWHLARRAAGWKTIDFTLPSLDGTGFYAGSNAEELREELNALKVADLSYADVLVRVDLDPSLGCHNCFALSSAFQSGGVHPNDIGQSILADLETKAVNKITGR